jgi:hypothetical protein
MKKINEFLMFPVVLECIGPALCHVMYKHTAGKHKDAMYAARNNLLVRAAVAMLCPYEGCGAATRRIEYFRKQSRMHVLTSLLWPAASSRAPRLESARTTLAWMTGVEVAFHNLDPSINLPEFNRSIKGRTELMDYLWNFSQKRLLKVHNKMQELSREVPAEFLSEERVKKACTIYLDLIASNVNKPDNRCIYNFRVPTIE